MKFLYIIVGAVLALGTILPTIVPTNSAQAQMANESQKAGNQPPLIDLCVKNPDDCILVPIWWWKFKWPPPPPDDGGCPVCGLLDWHKILSLPDNQKFAVSVKHGPAADTVIIEIPKVLSGPLLQNNTIGK